MKQFKSYCREKSRPVVLISLLLGPSMCSIFLLLFFTFHKYELTSAHQLYTETQKDYFYPGMKINHIFYSRFVNLIYRET